MNIYIYIYRLRERERERERERGISIFQFVSMYVPTFVNVRLHS